MADPNEGARDRFDGLRCQVPGCKKVIYALTGLQELSKMRAHMKRCHLAHVTAGEALELRAAWEQRGDETAKEKPGG